jgi:hypothetical protein
MGIMNEYMITARGERKGKKEANGKDDTFQLDEGRKT